MPRDRVVLPAPKSPCKKIMPCPALCLASAWPSCVMASSSLIYNSKPDMGCVPLIIVECAHTCRWRLNLAPDWPIVRLHRHATTRLNKPLNRPVNLVLTRLQSHRGAHHQNLHQP